ncbi:DUF5302 domain-containing protein [Nocardia callitridis]|uniref:DUF5302 domain-containing protein n=1 Tax=Nocardia callitridis TaxID=648753 RepID=A0ABP9KRJ0_9NOCA
MTQPEGPETTEQGADEVKRKFREALERKKQQTTTARDHLDGRSKASGAHSSNTHKREFRRKSG